MTVFIGFTILVAIAVTVITFIYLPCYLNCASFTIHNGDAVLMGLLVSTVVLWCTVVIAISTIEDKPTISEQYQRIIQQEEQEALN